MVSAAIRSFLGAALAIVALTLLAAAPAFAKDGIIVFGGTGRLGAPIVKILAEAGEDVTVFARAGSDESRLSGLKYTVATGDLLDDASIAAAFSARKYRAAIDASAQRGENRNPQFYQMVAWSIVTHARRAGVKHFIHHGSVGAGDNIRVVPALAGFKITPSLIDKGRAEKAIIESGLPYTIIRNGLLPPDPQPPATLKARLTEDQTTFTEVTRDDLARLTVSCIDNAACLNKIYHAVDETFPKRAPAGG